MPLFRDRFVRSLDTSMDGPGLEAVLAERGGSTAEELAATHRVHLFRGVNENHQPKYAAAVFDDVEHVDLRWRRALLVPGNAYLPTSETETTPLAARSQELVRSLEN